MKPRLNSSPLTEEDNLIWLLLDRLGGGVQDVTLARDADRRDADLMFEARVRRQHLPPWSAVYIGEIGFCGGPPVGSYSR